MPPRGPLWLVSVVAFGVGLSGVVFVCGYGAYRSLLWTGLRSTCRDAVSGSATIRNGSMCMRRVARVVTFTCTRCCGARRRSVYVARVGP